MEMKWTAEMLSATVQDYGAEGFFFVTPYAAILSNGTETWLPREDFEESEWAGHYFFERALT